VVFEKKSQTHSVLIWSFAGTQVYPAPRRWTNAYGDTALIAGVANGVVAGSHIAARNGFARIPLSWLEVEFSTWLMLALARTLAGAIVLVVVRFVSLLPTSVLLLLLK
jgi:hypothetical protein